MYSVIKQKFPRTAILSQGKLFHYLHDAETANVNFPHSIITFHPETSLEILFHMCQNRIIKFRITNVNTQTLRFRISRTST